MSQENPPLAAKPADICLSQETIRRILFPNVTPPSYEGNLTGTIIEMLKVPLTTYRQALLSQPGRPFQKLDLFLARSMSIDHPPYTDLFPTLPTSRQRETLQFIGQRIVPDCLRQSEKVSTQLSQWAGDQSNPYHRLVQEIIADHGAYFFQGPFSANGIDFYVAGEDDPVVITSHGVVYRFDGYNSLQIMHQDEYSGHWYCTRARPEATRLSRELIISAQTDSPRWPFTQHDSSIFTNPKPGQEEHRINPYHPNYFDGDRHHRSLIAIDYTRKHTSDPYRDPPGLDILTVLLHDIALQDLADRLKNAPKI